MNSGRIKMMTQGAMLASLFGVLGCIQGVYLMFF